MAITFRTETGERREIFAGAVLADREENGYHDSDFYAVVWDEEKQALRRIDYATTRFDGGGTCRIDATPEVHAKAQRWLAEWAAPQIERMKRAEAAEIVRGDRVRVVRGRKVKRGTEGAIRWMEERTYGYNRTVTHIGIEDAEGHLHCSYLHNVEKMDVVEPRRYAVLRLAVAFGRRGVYAAPFARFQIL